MANLAELQPSQLNSDSHLNLLRIINTWLTEIEATPDQRRRIVDCLDEGHLFSLPRSMRIQQLPGVWGPRNWRILFYSIAYILGWRKKRDFPDEIFHVARELWPDERERSSVGEIQRPLGSAGAAPPPITGMSTAGEASRERAHEGVGVCREPESGLGIARREGNWRGNITAFDREKCPQQCFVPSTAPTYKSEEAGYVREREAGIIGGEPAAPKSPDSL